MKRMFIASIISLFVVAGGFAQTGDVVTMKTESTDEVSIYALYTMSGGGGATVKANGTTVYNGSLTRGIVPQDDGTVIISITGDIELIRLDVPDIMLIELDVSKSTKLRHLICYLNNITVLDVSNNRELMSLDCSYNNIALLDVSSNKDLEFLNCTDNNIGQLDVSDNRKLRSLSCRSNNIDRLDVSNNEVLEALYCEDNNLDRLDVSNNILLKDLNCANNNIDRLDVSNNGALEALYCGFNNLNQLDVSNNMLLIDLNCNDNNLTGLNVSNNEELTHLNCAGNNIDRLDVSNNGELSILHCAFNNIEQLDVSNNMMLFGLFCFNNRISTLDLSHNLHISFMSASNQAVSIVVNEGAANFINPVYYHNSTGVEDVRIDGVTYAFGANVPIPADGNTVSFVTDETEISEHGSAFGGTITIEYGDVSSVKNNAVRTSVYAVGNGVFAIDTAGGDLFNVTVVNMQGQVVKTETAQGVSHTIDIANQPAGVYVFVVDDGTRKTTVKAVKR